MSSDETIDMTGQAGQEHVFSTVSAQRGEVEAFDLKPTFISLGLPSSAFKPEFRGSESAKTFDASVGGGTTIPGVAWFFMGEDYVRYDVANQTLAGPKTIAANWGSGNWPAMFASGVDAAISFTNQPGFVWFFKGPNYIRFNNLSNQVDLGPRPIVDGFRGWPENFTSIDCAVSGSGADSRLIYFFRGDECLPYDLTQDVAQGPVSQISGRFPLLSPFMRHPGLFLVETLSVSTYFGDVTAGAPQAGGRSLDPHEEETYTVIVSHSETQTISDTTTVLESQDQVLLDDLNSSMHDESSKSQSGDKYDYKFDSSFNGDLSYTGLGGSVDATLNFQGSSNDVRQAAATAARNAVQKQVSRTEQNRRQSTRVEAGSDVEHTETESTFTKSVKNPSDKPINIGVFQLFQEYLGLVVLTDVKLGFSNGSGPPSLFPLTELDAGLQQFVADEAQSGVIKSAILRELSGLLDYRNVTTNVTADTGDGRIAFSRNLVSTLDLMNTDGSLRRKIVVPGLLIHHYSFQQLTEAMILRELTVG